MVFSLNFNNQSFLLIIFNKFIHSFFRKEPRIIPNIFFPHNLISLNRISVQIIDFFKQFSHLPHINSLQSLKNLIIFINNHLLKLLLIIRDKNINIISPSHPFTHKLNPQNLQQNHQIQTIIIQILRYRQPLLIKLIQSLFKVQFIILIIYIL